MNATCTFPTLKSIFTLHTYICLYISDKYLMQLQEKYGKHNVIIKEFPSHAIMQQTRKLPLYWHDYIILGKLLLYQFALLLYITWLTSINHSQSRDFILATFNLKTNYQISHRLKGHCISCAQAQLISAEILQQESSSSVHGWLSTLMAEAATPAKEHLHAYYTWAMPFRELHQWLNSNKGLHGYKEYCSIISSLAIKLPPT